MTAKIASNVTIALTGSESLVESLFVLHAQPVTGHPVTATVGPTEKFWFKLILWLNLIAGNMFRVLVFRTISRQGFSRVPINLMIAVDECFKVGKQMKKCPKLYYIEI